jgi:hypothetical protein
MSASTQTAEQSRAAVARLRDFSLEQFHPHLPLRFPSHGGEAVPETFRARSWYEYPGWAGLTDADALANAGALYIALHLIDFSPLRGELVALRGLHVNGRGGTPFDPVSLFLCCLLRVELQRGWENLARWLASAEGACWQRLCGFTAGDTPSASVLRMAFHALGTAFHTDLCPRFIALLVAAGLLPPHDPQSAVPAREGLPLAVDGMLHDAHSTMQCSKVTDSCFKPTSAKQPRPCPAREAGKVGCACDTPACALHCKRVTPRDPEARFIHYTGRNQDGEKDAKRERNVHGYRSYAHTLVDDDLHTYWVAYSSVHPANTDERVIFPADFTQLRQRLPQIPLSELVADAALGFTACLELIYAAGAIPIVDIRSDPGDQDATTCLLRGYDDQGNPLCPHGFPLYFNGLDYARLRATWTCRQRCASSPEARATAECPYRDPERPGGMTKHITTTFTHPDGSTHARLARLFAFGSPTWKARYGSRRNATESRNAQLEALNLKRCWSYGLTGATADIAFADFLINLRALGRLVRQASALPD